MALIDKIKAIADAIREKTGSTGLMNLDEMAEMITAMDSSGGVTTLDNTYILVDENGYEVPASFTEEVVELTATTNDIRIGTTAVTDEGVVIGEKEIPNYRAQEGLVTVKTGRALDIPLFSDMCKYTSLQAIVCESGMTVETSVSADKVVIEDNVYGVGSTEVLSQVTVNLDTQTIKLGVTNDNDNNAVIRYMIIKEDERNG